MALHDRPKLVHLGLAFVLAVAIALLSVSVERVGPEAVQYGNLCGTSGADPCYQPALKGGFPFSYLFDTPGISRERQLAFVEDTLHPGALVLDIAVYFAAIVLIAQGIARCWSAWRRTSNREDA